MKKLVSVIVPTIGRPKFIKNAIDSIIAQDYENLEILISDNCPAVPTSEYLGQELDPRIKIITRAVRIESSEHMNICLAAASGEYVMILSDDDIIGKNYVSSMMSLFEANNVIVALGTQESITENDALVKESLQLPEFEIVDGRIYIDEVLSGRKKSPVLTYFSLFARRSDVIQTGGFQHYPDGSHADNCLFYSLAINGSVGISNAWMGYRVYPTSSGLSTPFQKLYLATYMYDKSMCSMVFKNKKISLWNKLRLRILFKLSGRDLLNSRLKNIYKPKISTSKYIFYRFMVFFYLFSVF